MIHQHFFLIEIVWRTNSNFQSKVWKHGVLGASKHNDKPTSQLLMVRTFGLSTTTLPAGMDN